MILYPQAFLGSSESACLENSGLGRNIYKKFWKTLNNLGLRQNNDYQKRKNAAGCSKVFVVHSREIMPTCVVDKVRRLYPNPSDKPYMGHKSE